MRNRSRDKDLPDCLFFLRRYNNESKRPIRAGVHSTEEKRMALENSMEAPKGETNGKKSKVKKVPERQLTEEQSWAQDEELKRTGTDAEIEEKGAA